MDKIFSICYVDLSVMAFVYLYTIPSILSSCPYFIFYFAHELASPYFSAPSRMVTVKKGDTAVLQCEVNGDKPINVIWLRAGKHELNPTTNYR